MKTQMHVKTNLSSFGNALTRNKTNRNGKNRLTVFNGFAGCAVLIAILAVSGYAGMSSQGKRPTAAAPVVSRILIEEEYDKLSFQEIENRLAEERAQELALLESVGLDENANESVKKSALEQKLEIAGRMETEAQIRYALMNMGISEAAAVCADGRILLLIPAQYAQNQSQSTRMIDAVCTVSGCEAKDVKIILIKK